MYLGLPFPLKHTTLVMKMANIKHLLTCLKLHLQHQFTTLAVVFTQNPLLYNLYQKYLRSKIISTLVSYPLLIPLLLLLLTAQLQFTVQLQNINPYLVILPLNQLCQQSLQSMRALMSLPPILHLNLSHTLPLQLSLPHPDLL
uniref:Uncharacterized protein n=1 Tax=Cacopsylla melanoneura TaxID=428564 RepID=A0A8D8VRT9_9HEMI